MSRSGIGWLVAAASLAAFAVSAWQEPAMAQPDARHGAALVIGVGWAGGCTTTARAVAARLGGEGLAVTISIEPVTMELRSVLDDFAASLETSKSSPAPAPALVYVCAPAVVSGARLFMLPSDADPADFVLHGVVLQALLNALAGTDGALYADLRLAAPDGSVSGAASGPADAIQKLRTRLPAGLHVALTFPAGTGETGVGPALAGPAMRPDAGWNEIGARLAGSHATGRIIMLPEPAAVQTTLSPSAVAAAPAPLPPLRAAALASLPPPRAAALASLPPPRAAALASLPPPRVAAVASLPSPLAAAPASSPPPATLPRMSPNLPAAHSTMSTLGPASIGSAGTWVRTPAIPPQVPASPRKATAGRIERLQRAFARKGLYQGPLTGRFDDETVMAARTFQRSLGTAQTGVLTQAEIVRLLND